MRVRLTAEPNKRVKRVKAQKGLRGTGLQSYRVTGEQGFRVPGLKCPA